MRLFRKVAPFKHCARSLQLSLILTSFPKPSTHTIDVTVYGSSTFSCPASQPSGGTGFPLEVDGGCTEVVVVGGGVMVVVVVTPGHAGSLGGTRVPLGSSSSHSPFVPQTTVTKCRVRVFLPFASGSEMHTFFIVQLPFVSQRTIV